MSQQTEGSTGRTMRVAGVGKSMQAMTASPSFASRRTAPSVRRSDEERERRHRERTIAAWLRSLNR